MKIWYFDVFSGTLETAAVSQENSPPLPNGPAPSQPPPPQFDSDDLDKLPPLPPGSPPPVPGICDVPLRKFEFNLLLFFIYTLQFYFQILSCLYAL